MHHLPQAWAGAFDGTPGVVFAAGAVDDAWPSVLAELEAAFAVAQEAARDGSAVVFIVATYDLLGRGGAGPAMVAAGILSAARTAAVEMAKAGVPVNVLAVDAEVDPATAARWAGRLCEAGGPTGELVHLGPAHIGKALA
jgi:hypothetical protein